MLNTSTTTFSIPALNNSLVPVCEGTGLARILPVACGYKLYSVSDAWLMMNLTAQSDNEMVANESYGSTDVLHSSCTNTVAELYQVQF